MPDMKLPPSPFGKTCETCMFWHAPSRGKYYATENGQYVPVSAVSIANLPEGSALLGTGQIDMAPCTQGPAWFPAPADHWCWQHPGAQKVVLNARYGKFNTEPRAYSNPDQETQERLASEQDRAPRR